MKTIHLYLAAGVFAIVLLAISMAGFSYDVEKWSSLFAGFAVGLFLVIGQYKARQGSVK